MIPLIYCMECRYTYRIDQLFVTPHGSQCCPRCKRYLLNKYGMTWNADVMVDWQQVQP